MSWPNTGTGAAWPTREFRDADERMETLWGLVLDSRYVELGAEGGFILWDVRESRRHCEPLECTAKCRKATR